MPTVRHCLNWAAQAISLLAHIRAMRRYSAYKHVIHEPFAMAVNEDNNEVFLGVRYIVQVRWRRRWLTKLTVLTTDLQAELVMGTGCAECWDVLHGAGPWPYPHVALAPAPHFHTFVTHRTQALWQAWTTQRAAPPRGCCWRGWASTRMARSAARWCAGGLLVGCLSGRLSKPPQ